MLVPSYSYDKLVRQKNDKSLYYFFECTDSLSSRRESKRTIEYTFSHNHKDTNPIIFIYEKNSKYFVEKIPDISSINLLNRDNILKLEKEYFTSYEKEETKIMFFPKWLENKYSSFYVVEKKDDEFYKYKVSITQIQVDYIFK
jgi:hypothetical protein